MSMLSRLYTEYLRVVRTTACSSGLRSGEARWEAGSDANTPILEPAEPRLLLSGPPLQTLSVSAGIADNGSIAVCSDPSGSQTADTAGSLCHYNYILWDRATGGPAPTGTVPAQTAAPYGLSPTQIRGGLRHRFDQRRRRCGRRHGSDHCHCRRL